MKSSFWTMMRLFCGSVWLMVGFGGWLLGCSQPTSSNCTQDSECAVGEVCRKNVCARNNPSGCQKDKDCYNGLKCELATGQCVRCLANQDCNTGQTCVGGQCSSQSSDGGTESAPDSSESVSPQENTAETSPLCRSDADCSPQQVCDLASGQCKPKVGTPCQQDLDCLADSYCVSGSCSAGRRFCQNNTDCHKDFDCRGGFCYRTRCQGNIDCPPGETCDAAKGQCNPANPQDCTQSGCPSGQTCNTTTKQCETFVHCAQKGCAAGETCNATTGQCENTQDCTQSGCPSGQTCNTTTKRCETQSSSCTSDASCIPPQGTCFQGKCVNCTQSGCSNGLWCNSSSGTCIQPPPKCSSETDCSAPTGSCIQGGCLSCASHFSCTSPTVCDRASGKCVTPPCSSDNDCLPPKGSCQGGKCLSCQGDFSCASGEQCQSSSGRCLPPQPTCTSDSQCTSPYGTCRNGSCDSCLNFSCPSGQSCSASTGRCVSSSSCTTDSQCFSPLGWCRSGTCTSCVLYNCPSGQTCNSSTGRCTATSACTADTQCSTPDGWCRNGTCTTCLFYSCDSSLRCNTSTGRCEPRTCTSNTDCRSPRGACYQGKCLSCQGDFTCPTDQTCDTTTGLCQPKPQCIKHQDCGSGELCLSSRCIRNDCNLVKPCPNGQKCYGRTCVPVYTRCYSYLCGAKEVCLYGPDKTDTCHRRCDTTACSSTQECLSVSFKEGGTEKFCFNKPSLDVNASCTPGHLNKRCKNDGVCINTSSFSSTGYCYDRCTPGSSLGCKSTQECAELSPGQGLCLSKGTRTRGSSCDLWSSRCQGTYECLPSGLSSSYSGTCYSRCTAIGSSGTTPGCQAQEVCIASAYSTNSGICAPQGTRLEGLSCTLFSSYQCQSSSLVCATPPSGYSDEGACQVRCQSASNCPNSGEDCVNGVCLPKATGTEGSSCRFDSSVGSYHCKQGLECYIAPESTSSYGTCKKKCQSDADCSSTTYNQCIRGYCERKGTISENSTCSSSSSSSSCKSGLFCVSVSSFSDRCLQPCQSSSQCSTSYPECASGFCVAKGTLKEDDYCYDSMTSRCGAGLQCATPPGSSFASRRCLSSCDTNTDCTGTYKICADSSDGSRVCYK